MSARIIPELTQDELKRPLDYNPETGEFRWKVNRRRIRAGSVAGTTHRCGYRQISVDSHNYKAHRLAWLYVYGKWPSLMIDHINGVRDDNRIANLRDVTCSENFQNKRGAKGYYWHKENKRWVVQIKVNRLCGHVGCFLTEADARAAYLAAKAIWHPTSPIRGDTISVACGVMGNAPE